MVIRIRDMLEEMQGRGANVDTGGADNTRPTIEQRWGGLRVLSPSGFIISETSDLPNANSDGTVTLEPGDEQALVEYRSRGDTGVACLAVGANDVQDVQYGLRIDRSKVVGGRTESPLGVLNDPFSFVDSLNAVVPANDVIEYVAYYDASATGTVDMAARLYTDEP